jgi:DNA-directed RNA polymerase specialized sigma24 family protein
VFALMALPAARPAQSPSDPGGILEAAYPQAKRIAFARWLGQIDQSEIEALVDTAVVKLLDGDADVIDVPQTTKYLTTFVDWRAKDQLRTQRRHDEAPLPDDETHAPDALQQALTDPRQTPEEAMDSAHVRAVVADIRRRIPSRVNRLIVHLFYSEDQSCPQIAQTVERVLGVELSPKAVEMRKRQALSAMVTEWGRAWRGDHCRELTTKTRDADHDALTRYALDLLDLGDEQDADLHDLVSAHLEHCAPCRAELVVRRRELRRAALLAVPILVGPSDAEFHTAEHAITHAPSVFERTLDAIRSGVGRGSMRAAETLPNRGPTAGDMVGPAAGGGTAVGGGLAAKVLIAGTTAACAIGGQQLCVKLLTSSPAPHPRPAQTAALRPKFPPSHRTAPAPRAAQVQSRAAAAAGAGQLAQAGAGSIRQARQRQASSPSASSGSSTGTGGSDPTFSPTAPTTSSGSGGGGGGSGGSSGGSGSSSDSTFQGLP